MEENPLSWLCAVGGSFTYPHQAKCCIITESVPHNSIWCSLGILLNKYLRVVVSWRKARRPREDRRRRMCELGLAEDFYRRGKDVPYILIKVDPKPRKAGRHNSKPRRKKERQKLRLDFTLFPRGISLNGTLVPPMFRFIFFGKNCDFVHVNRKNYYQPQVFILLIL